MERCTKKNCGFAETFISLGNWATLTEERPWPCAMLVLCFSCFKDGHGRWSVVRLPNQSVLLGPRAAFIRWRQVSYFSGPGLGNDRGCVGYKQMGESRRCSCSGCQNGDVECDGMCMLTLVLRFLEVRAGWMSPFFCFFFVFGTSSLLPHHYLSRS